MLPEVVIKHRLRSLKLLQLSNCSSKHAEQKEYFTGMILSRQLTIQANSSNSSRTSYHMKHLNWIWTIESRIIKLTWHVISLFCFVSIFFLFCTISPYHRIWQYALYLLSYVEYLPVISVHLIAIFFRYAAAVNSWSLILVLVPSCSTFRICNGYLSFWTCFIKVITTLNIGKELSSLFQ